MKSLILILLLLPLFAIGGCGDRYDASKVNNPSAEQMDAAKARRDEMVAIYKRAGGDWNAMTPQDRQRVIELSGGNEALAMQGWPSLARLAK